MIRPSYLYTLPRPKRPLSNKPAPRLCRGEDWRCCRLRVSHHIFALTQIFWSNKLFWAGWPWHPQADTQLTLIIDLPADIPAINRIWTNVVLMLGQRRRRWPNIKTTFIQILGRDCASDGSMSSQPNIQCPKTITTLSLSKPSWKCLRSRSAFSQVKTSQRPTSMVKMQTIHCTILHKIFRPTSYIWLACSISVELLLHGIYVNSPYLGLPQAKATL